MQVERQKEANDFQMWAVLELNWMYNHYGTQSYEYVSIFSLPTVQQTLIGKVNYTVSTSSELNMDLGTV